MNTKLTLSLDRDTIERAKAFAGRRHKSLSKMVEDYLRQVTTTERSGAEITPLVTELSGLIPAEKADKHAAGYADYLKKKYK
jgi:hypothetical protein